MAFEKQRKQMVAVCAEMGITDKKVLDAMLKIPRHLFIPPGLIDRAYENHPLDIGKGQTISQPYTVAFMLQALELKKGDKVLEIGTGSGYNTALIAEIIKPGIVYTTEVIAQLVKLSGKNLNKLKLKNIRVLAVDGSAGHRKQAPYNKIIITAACPEIPRPLISQLKNKGILVAPVGEIFSQRMIKAKKIKTKLEKKNLGCFVFVPLRGKYGFK